MSQPIQISSYHDYHLQTKVKYHSECPECIDKYLTPEDQKVIDDNSIRSEMFSYASMHGNEALREMLETQFSLMMGKEYGFIKRPNVLGKEEKERVVDNANNYYNQDGGN